MFLPKIGRAFPDVNMAAHTQKICVDSGGFILVIPTGLGLSASGVQVVRDIFKNIATHLNIDHKRVYATGHSFGGALSQRMLDDGNAGDCSYSLS